MRNTARHPRPSARCLRTALVILSLAAPAASGMAGERLGRLILSPEERDRLQSRQDTQDAASPYLPTGSLSRGATILKRWSRHPGSGEVIEEPSVQRPGRGVDRATGGDVQTPSSKHALPGKNTTP